jgi:hypothetical protein
MRLRALKSIYTLQFSDQLIETLIGEKIFFSQNSHVGYQKIRLFD